MSPPLAATSSKVGDELHFIPRLFTTDSLHVHTVILTRLQRVTFLTAHKYLGLTREVIRTEKAINELANYPLPEAFWETGGVQRLRQRFVPETKLAAEPEEEEQDYFTLDTPYATPAQGDVFWDDSNERSSDEGVKLRYRPARTPRARGRGDVTRKAGDLLSMSTVADENGFGGLFSPSVVTPRIERGGNSIPPAEDFDLRDAVMECISKAIGLVQGASTPGASVDHSPMVRPQDSNLQKAMFNSSFGSLSLLGLQGYDDESSMTGSSVASFSETELENEVEVLYFPKGSTLVKEGEKNAGLYYVIEGFLDVSMPEPTQNTNIKNDPRPKPTTNIPPTSSAASAKARSAGPNKTPSRQSSGDTRPSLRNAIPRATQAHFDKFSTALPPLAEKTTEDSQNTISLFTVKPGGIAGYLSSLSGFPSYVDITAKTECYVGFLPAKALERMMDRKPIVLLTLAKRLISLLSPLSELFPSPLARF